MAGEDQPCRLRGMGWRMLRRRAFTLVELLVVVAVIAVLIAILLPALRRARETAYRVSCASNMRQLALAFLLYANDHRGFLPAPGWWKQVRDEDWIHWQTDRDLRQSRILKYLGSNLAVLRCPAGVLQPPESYPFSYGVNVLLTGRGWKDDGSQFTVPSCKLAKVVQPSHKILVIEENAERINDGGWKPNEWLPVNRYSDVSVRHDREREYSTEVEPPYPVPRDSVGWTSRGNIVCVDGHWEFVERAKLIGRAEYWWDPNYAGGP